MQSRRNRAFLSILSALFIALVAIPLSSVHAHDRVEVGDYVIIVGWVTEPVIVGERNALLFDVSKNGVPIEGLEGTLDIEVTFAGEKFLGDLHPEEKNGLYTTELFPTAKGQYEVRISGQIEDLEVDVMATPEEVLSARILQFPESVAETRELEQSLVEMQAAIERAQLFGNIGTATGAIGIITGLVGVLAGRKKTEPDAS